MRSNLDPEVAATTAAATWMRRAIGMLALGLFAAGCSAGIDRAGPRDVLWESGFDYVRIEPQDGIDRGVPPNAHPAHFTAEQVRDLLAPLRIRPVAGTDSLFHLTGRDGAQPVPLFSAADLDKIAQPVAEALARAGPREDVALAVSSLREGPIVDFLDTSRTTSARVFVQQDGRLNVVFGIVHAALKDEVKKSPTGTPKGEYVSRIDERRYRPRPGSRTSPAPVSLALEPHPALYYASTAGRRRADWVMIDPEVVLAAAARERAARAAPAAATAELDATAERIAEEQAALQRKVEALEREMRTGPADEPSLEAGEAAVARAIPPDEVEQRLTRLRDLYDRELIADDLYLAESAKVVAGLRALPVEDRLKRLTALYKRGLIAKSVYLDEAGRALDGG